MVCIKSAVKGLIGPPAVCHALITIKHMFWGVIRVVSQHEPLIRSWYAVRRAVNVLLDVPVNVGKIKGVHVRDKLRVLGV